MGENEKYVMIDGLLVKVPKVENSSATAVTPSLVDWVIQEEGFNETPTNIGDGKITLGSGLTDPKWHKLYRSKGNKWSQEDNRNAVTEELNNREIRLKKHFPNWDNLTPSAKEALLSYKYNYNFTSGNSPKLFQAAKDLNYWDMMKQMDATSNDPKFKKGLQERRNRERQHLINGTSVYKLLYDKDRSEGVVHSPYEVMLKLYPNHQRKEGGSLNSWDELSMQEKADMIRVAVRNGLIHLDDIKNRYNEFAKGGKISDQEYIDIMEKVADENYKKWGFENPDEALIHALNDNTYNYRGYYNKYPKSRANADTHWTDEFKTVYHPTFSKESVYSGKESQYNPNGRTGGFWLGGTFIPAPWQLFNSYADGGGIHIKPSHRGTFTAAASRHGKSVQEFASQVLAHKENYSPAMVKKANFARNAAKWKHGEGGTLFEDGGPVIPPIENSSTTFEPMDYDFGMEQEQPVLKVNKKVMDVTTPVPFSPQVAKQDVRDFYVNDFVQRRQKYHPETTAAQVENLYDNANVSFDKLSPGIAGLRSTTTGDIKIKSTLNDNQKRSTLSHEMRHLMDDKLGGLTPEENQILHDAYNLKVEKDYNWLEREYPTTNTELRYKISRDNGNVLGDALNDVINNMTDNDLLNRANWVNGYNNIPDKLLTPKNEKQLLEQKKKADAIRKALIEVAQGSIPDLGIQPLVAAYGGYLYPTNGNSTAHIYDGITEDNQQIQFGRNYWQSNSDLPSFLNIDFPINGGQLQEIVITGKDRRKEKLARLQKIAEKRAKNYLITSNDNTWVENSASRKVKNPHLTDRTIEGAKSYEAWAKEHPIMNAWGMALGAAPFAVAAYPFVSAAGSGLVTLGDAAAATSAGQTVTSALAPVATAATTKLPLVGASTAELANLGLSSWFGVEGIQNAINEGGISPMTALEIAPMFQAVKPAARMATQAIEDMSYPLGRPIVPKGLFEASPYESFNYYHGGLDPDFDFSTLDVFRLGSKQGKRGRDYAGFYMHNNRDKLHAFGYGQGEAHGIKISDDANILKLDQNVERMTQSELKHYKDQGYDMITGYNIWREPEYILLNKDIIEDAKFFQEAPKNELRLFKTPKDILNKEAKLSKKSSTADWKVTTTNERLGKIH